MKLRGLELAADTMSRITPSHIAPDLVRNFDFFSDPRLQSCPFAVMSEVANSGTRLFYTPKHYMLPGSWVLTRAEDIRFVYGNPDLFSSESSINFSGLIGESWRLIPLELDQPLHGSYRQVLNPMFSGLAVAKFDSQIRQLANEFLDGLADQNGCEFVSSFGRAFPVAVFLMLLGLPQERRPEFVKWTVGLLSSFQPDLIRDSARAIADCLREEIKSRRRKPREDLLTQVSTLSVDRRLVSEDEALGMAFLLFIAGLKTVASSLGFHFHHLAVYGADQSRLREDQTLIPAAVDEFVRLYSISNNHRRALRDVEVGGVLIKAGDWITLPTMNGSRDRHEFSDPDRFELGRANTRHLGFGYGAHRCLGSLLARREFCIALEVWFTRLPPFRLKPGSDFRTTGGGTFGVEELRLEWGR